MSWLPFAYKSLLACPLSSKDIPFVECFVVVLADFKSALVRREDKAVMHSDIALKVFIFQHEVSSAPVMQKTSLVDVC